MARRSQQRVQPSNDEVRRQGPRTNVGCQYRSGPPGRRRCYRTLVLGTVTYGEPVYQIKSRRQGRVQQGAKYNGPQRENVGKLSPGNIPALTGLENVKA